jgi:uncharacterized protein
MTDEHSQTYTAFEGHKLMVNGSLERVVLKVKSKLKSEASASILIFSDATGKQMDFDLSGTEQAVLQRLHVFLPMTRTEFTNGPGRPKLGVVSREVSLLPRHWEWLSTQSGGASATLRRLVDEARKFSSSKSVAKQAQERTYKIMSSIAGDFPLYEDALRALFKGDKKTFEAKIANWPPDIKNYLLRVSMDAS